MNRFTFEHSGGHAREPWVARAAMIACRLAIPVALTITCAAPMPLSAAEFYAGKTIDLLIGGNVGGGYDIYARVISRHLGRFIPGRPTIVAKNMPGAGSARAASFLYSVAPKDGSVIGALFPGVIISPLLEERSQPLFDPTKFQYLAAAENATRVCITHARSPIRSYADALERRAIMGATAAGGATRDYATMHRKASGAKFELAAGYRGTADILLAMERGEVDGLCGFDWASLKSQRPDWISSKSLHILVQDNLEPEPELNALGVPQIWQYVRNPEDKQAVALIVSQQVFGRPYLAPPGVPTELTEILRRAFSATLQDKDFLADAERTRIDVAPSSGERVQRLVEEVYATPKAIVERARELLWP
jgi:tripartite-type tricarboxylate transporter receptor subunit TctC